MLSRQIGEIPHDIDNNDEEEEEESYQTRVLTSQPPAETVKIKHINPISNHLKIGIIGMVNVGKSNLFNIIGQSKHADVDNFLFSTLDPCISTACIRDDNVEYINQVFKPKNTSRLHVSVVDTGGIIENSIHGEGIGLSTLESLIDVDVIIHLLRGFHDESITHYYETVDPIRDLRIVQNEILMKDLRKVEDSIVAIEDTVFIGEGGKYLSFELETLIKAWKALAGIPRPDTVRDKKKRVVGERLFPDRCEGIPLLSHAWENNEIELLPKFQFLTCKEVIYVLNTSSHEYLRVRSPLVDSITQEISTPRYGQFQASSSASRVVLVSLDFENKLVALRESAQSELEEYLRANTSHRSAVGKIVSECSRALGAIKFFTCNAQEVRCWSLRYGKTLSEAASLLGTDIHRNFIRGDVISFDDFVKFGGDQTKLLLEMKVRNPGKKYIVSNNDIITFYHKSS